MSKHDSTTGNVAIGLAVAVLGFVVYKMFINPTMVSTSTPATANQTNTAALAAQTAIPAVSGLLSNLFKSSAANPTSSANSSLFGSLSGVLGNATTSSQLDQTYTSTALNPDQISADIGSDTLSSMSSAGESDIDSWGFSL